MRIVLVNSPWPGRCRTAAGRGSIVVTIASVMAANDGGDVTFAGFDISASESTSR